MLSLLHERKTLIRSITKYEHRLDGSFEQFKAVANLIDGSKIHIGHSRKINIRILLISGAAVGFSGQNAYI